MRLPTAALEQGFVTYSFGIFVISSGRIIGDLRMETATPHMWEEDGGITRQPGALGCATLEYQEVGGLVDHGGSSQCRK